MRAWLVCVVASSCYLQPTVFEGGGAPPRLIEEAPPPPPPREDVVGCITHEPSYRRRVAGKWWIGERRVAANDVDRALAASPIATPSLMRALAGGHATLALGVTGMALAHASIVSAVTWAGLDEHAGEKPLYLLAPAAA